jgi:hypothetical protein
VQLLLLLLLLLPPPPVLVLLQSDARRRDGSCKLHKQERGRISKVEMNLSATWGAVGFVSV